MKSACLIPCYNEALRLDKQVYQQLFVQTTELDFYLLNDGSTDETAAVLQELAKGYPNVTVFDYQENRGKAGVIREAMMSLADSDYEYIGFLDADFATPFEEFQRLLEIARASNFEVVFGSRVKLKGWNISRNPVRHVFSRIILTLIDSLFKLEIYDTQCGCKLYQTKLIPQLFTEPFVTKWLFDIEVFIRYLRPTDNPSIKEIPLIKWTEIKGSKLKLSDFLQVPWNIWQLYRFYGAGKRR